jgi:hypothetical protein
MAIALGIPLDLEAAPGASARRFAAVREQLEARGIDLSADGVDHRFRVGTHGDDSADLRVRPEVDPTPIDWANADLRVGQDSAPA